MRSQLISDDMDWEHVRRVVLDLLEATRHGLTDDAVDAATYYIDVDEYEIALEGLILDIMRAFPLPPSDVDWASYRALCQRLSMDTDSVIDGHFWPKFLLYTEGQASA